MELEKSNIHLYKDICRVIEQARSYVAQSTNSTLTFMYWQIGDRINKELIDGECAAYGKQIVSQLATILQEYLVKRRFNEKSNMQKMHIPNSNKPVAFYNLDVIISVGYRVKSKQGTQFRIWATNVLRDYLLKGYALNQRMNRIENNYKGLSKEVKQISLQLKTQELPTQGILRFKKNTYGINITR